MSRGASYISRLVAAICSNSRQQHQHAARIAAATVQTHGYTGACLQHQEQAQYVSQSPQQSWAVQAHAWQPSTQSGHALTTSGLYRMTCARHISSCSSSWHDSSSGSASGNPASISNDSSSSDSASASGRGKDMGIVFTCAKCDTRSIKAFSRHSYEKGLVLIRCPGCQSLHLIADHLGWFGDTSFKIDEYMAAQGQTVKRISLDPAQQQQQQQAEQLTAEDMAGWSKVQQLLSTVAAASGGQKEGAADKVQDSGSHCGSGSSSSTDIASSVLTDSNQDAGHAAQAAAAAAESGVVQVSPEDVEAWVRVQRQQQGPKGNDS